MGKRIWRTNTRDYKIIEWEYLISISEAREMFNKNVKTIRMNIENGAFVNGIDCKKVGKTWVLDIRRLKEVYDK